MDFTPSARAHPNTCTGPSDAGPTITGPIFLASPGGRTRPSIVSIVARTVAVLVSIASAGIGVIVAGVSWIIAVMCFDGSPVFGCSDGTKHPDPTAGVTYGVLGLVALTVGFGVAFALLGAATSRRRG